MAVTRAAAAFCAAGSTASALCRRAKAVLAQMHALIHSRADSEACVSWGRWHLRRYNGRLYLLPQVPHSAPTGKPSGTRKAAAPGCNGSCVSAAPSAEGWPQARTLCACARAVSAATPPSASIPKPSKPPGPPRLNPGCATSFRWYTARIVWWRWGFMAGSAGTVWKMGCSLWHF